MGAQRLGRAHDEGFVVGGRFRVCPSYGDQVKFVAPPDPEWIINLPSRDLWIGQRNDHALAVEVFDGGVNGRDDEQAPELPNCYRKQGAVQPVTRAWVAGSSFDNSHEKTGGPCLGT
jgi:hypothetical protein